MTETSSVQFIERILPLLEEEKKDEIKNIVESLTHKEIVHLFGHMGIKNEVKLLNFLPAETAAEVLEELPEAIAIEIIEEMKSEDAASILNEMESDEQADLIMELDDKEAQEILSKMDPVEAANAMKLISYEYDTAGGLMRTEFFAYSEDKTIQFVIADLRENENVYRYYLLKYIFVTTTDFKLKGVVQMQDMLMKPPATKLSEITNPNIHSVDHLTKLDELNTFFHEHDFFGVPVTDNRGVLSGIVLRRDILEAENERVTYEHLETQGIVGGDELRTMPVVLRAKRRLSWLSVNILLNILAASVIAYHQDILSSVIALAVFLPIISDMSGCSGNQTVAVSMRELSLGVVNPAEILRVWYQEVSVGLINGLVLGVLIGLAAWLWQGNVYLGLVAGGALAVNTIVAVSLGGTIPLILKGFDVDPALASGPILTTVTDMFGFFLALTFASQLMSGLTGI